MSVCGTRVHGVHGRLFFSFRCLVSTAIGLSAHFLVAQTLTVLVFCTTTPTSIAALTIMSLLSTSVIKAQMNSALGDKSPKYWKTLRQYLCGRVSRTEFDEQVKECLDTTLLCTSRSNNTCFANTEYINQCHCTTHSLYLYSIPLPTLHLQPHLQTSPNNPHASVVARYPTRAQTTTIQEHSGQKD